MVFCLGGNFDLCVCMTLCIHVLTVQFRVTGLCGIAILPFGANLAGLSEMDLTGLV